MAVVNKWTLLGDEGENANEKGKKEKSRDIWGNVWCDGMLPKELRNVSASPLIRNSDLESMAAVWQVTWISQ